jgi:hypothetical protein
LDGKVAAVFAVAVKVFVGVELEQDEIGLGLESKPFERATGAFEFTGLIVPPIMPRDLVLSNSTGIVVVLIALEEAL